MLWLTAGPGRALERGVTAWSHRAPPPRAAPWSGTHRAPRPDPLSLWAAGENELIQPWLARQSHGHGAERVRKAPGRMGLQWQDAAGGGWERHPQRLTGLQGTGTQGPIGTWPPVPHPAPWPGGRGGGA